MSIVVAGIVNNGVVVPREPLPEGAQVEIHVSGEPPEVPSELDEELMAWRRASANALALVEQMAQENQANEER